MIPRKLELRNFLSYADKVQTINFTEHSLICLSGKNGNGKSALLDAMTWALWGQARKVSGVVRPDEGLVRLGQSRMMVSFEFEFNSNFYRVRREFAKTHNKPYHALNFELYNPETKSFFSLTEKTVRQTQAKIETLLGLDYETYVNSAFLRQGQSNEFSKKNPKERKQILANILGLSKYDKLNQVSLDRVREFGDEKRVLVSAQGYVAVELDKEFDFKSKLIQTNDHLREHLKELEQLNIEFNKVQEQKSKIVEQRNLYGQILEELDNLREKERCKLGDFKKSVNEWRAVHLKSLKLPDIRLLEKTKTELMEKEKCFLELKRQELVFQSQILQKKDLYQKRLALLESKFEKKLNELKLTVDRNNFLLTQTTQILKQKKQQMKSFEAKHSEHVREFDQISKKLRGKDNFEKIFSKLKTQFEKRHAFYQRLKEKERVLKIEKFELEQKKKAVQNFDNPACPFCEQVLTVKRKQFLNLKISKSEHFIDHCFNRVSSLLKKLKAILIEQHKQFEDISKEVDLYKQLEVKINDLKIKMEECKKEFDFLSKECSDLEKKETENKVTLDREKDLLVQQEAIRLIHFAKDKELNEIMSEIKDTEEKMRLLTEKFSEYSQIQEEIKLLESQIGAFSQVQDEIKMLPQKLVLIKMIKSDLKDLRNQILLLNKKLENLKIYVETEKKVERHLSEIKGKMEIIFKQKDTLIQQIGQLENELQRLEKLKVETKQRLDKIKEIEKEIEDYQFLANTFGKNGIQSLLIEEAIPEIEQEANRILSRLTDNQAQIFIESLRDLKHGGVKETMDIQISDTAGIRPYEMFSGGETFRFDFALRIAISKLLARRAGTALQTLIIDEGFGSQDDEGLVRVMDAIHAIQDDFFKIIVVSHLSEFKDNFPVHFVVEKTATGSVVQIEERG